MPKAVVPVVVGYGLSPPLPSQPSHLNDVDEVHSYAGANNPQPRDTPSSPPKRSCFSQILYFVKTYIVYVGTPPPSRIMWERPELKLEELDSKCCFMKKQVEVSHLDGWIKCFVVDVDKANNCVTLIPVKRNCCIGEKIVDHKIVENFYKNVSLKHIRSPEVPTCTYKTVALLTFLVILIGVFEGVFDYIFKLNCPMTVGAISSFELAGVDHCFDPPETFSSFFNSTSDLFNGSLVDEMQSKPYCRFLPSLSSSLVGTGRGLWTDLKEKTYRVIRDPMDRPPSKGFVFNSC